MELKNAVGVLRVSSIKQGLQGDSTDQQRAQIEHVAGSRGYRVIHYLTYIESASGEVQPLQEAVNYCTAHKDNIKALFIKSIDRFTRGGSIPYQNLKIQLSRNGQELIDVFGVVNNTTINTLEYLNLKYSWSVYNPNLKSEILEAERAKDEVRDILSRMIGAEAEYVRNGYHVRPSPMGYQNTKVDTDDGKKRVILTPETLESPWFIRMFELRAQGNLTDDQIIDEVNMLGYRSRVIKVHDKQDKKRTIGHTGQKKLTVKQLQKYIQNPIYAGVNTEKWLEGKPIKTRFPGLVSIDLFNKANHGKMVIEETPEGVRIINGPIPSWQNRKLKLNPKFPYKQYVLCPMCRNEVYGSSPRGKSKPHPAYHCGRKIDGKRHWFYKNITDFNNTIRNFVTNVRFSD